MSEHDVVAVAWIDAEDAEMLKAAGRVKTILYCGSAGGFLPLYSQATVDAMQERIDELEKDAARMDWLDSKSCAFDHRSYGDYYYYAGHYPDGPKAREVIDAAMIAEVRK